MILPKLRAKIKYLPPEIPLIAIMLLVSLGSFLLGRLSVLTKARYSGQVQNLPMEAKQPMPLGGLFVASRRGSNYYYPWCSGATRIASENRIWFKNEAAARAAGYTPSASCKGLGR